jgi:hypothetical protein
MKTVTRVTKRPPGLIFYQNEIGVSLNRESQSRHHSQVILDSQENLNLLKKLLLTSREILIAIGLDY